MWIFKGLLFLVLLFALVYFFVTNSGQSVDINFFGKAFLGISIYWVVVVSFLVGFATSFVLAAFREFGFQRELGRMRKAAKAKDREIADLRTLPLRHDDAGGSVENTTGEKAGD